MGQQPALAMQRADRPSIGQKSRLLAALLALVLAGCGSGGPTPTPGASGPVSSGGGPTITPGNGPTDTPATPTAPTAAVSPSPAPTAEPTPASPTPVEPSASPSAPAATPTASPTPSPAPTASSPATVGTWTQLDDMTVPRWSFAAVPLLDGRVFVVGDNGCGVGDLGGLSLQADRAELLDPSSGQWTPAESLNAQRDGFAAVRLLDGRVLVAGGLNAQGISFSSTKIFDPTTGHWSSSGLLNTARWRPAGALLPDGRVLVAGGQYVTATSRRELATAELYDPRTGRWTPTGNLHLARPHAIAYPLPDGRVLVVSHSDSAEQPAEIYDPTTGSWAVAGQPPSRPGSSSVLLADGSLLVIGGSPVGNGGVQALDPGVWRFDPTSGASRQVHSMPTGRSGAVAVLLADGRVLVAGGTDQVSADPTHPAPATDAVAIYDPVRDAWSQGPPMPFAAAPGAGALLADGSIVVAGGTTPPRDIDACAPGQPVPWTARFVPAAATAVISTGDVAQVTTTRAAPNPAAATAVATSITGFGLDLYRAMLADPGLHLANSNAVFSPTSIALAFGMARAGAVGQTAAELDAVFHSTGWAAFGSGLNSLDQALTSRNGTWQDDNYPNPGTHELALQIANAAYAQRGWAIQFAYLRAIGAFFGAGLRLVDFVSHPAAAVKAINDWVRGQTKGRIPTLLQPDDVSAQTRLVLVNAMYLKANWLHEFDPNSTGPVAFTRLDGTRIQVPTMSQFGGQEIPLARGKGWQAVELRYRGPDTTAPAGLTAPLALTIIGPDDLAAFEHALTAGQLGRITAALQAERARITEVANTGNDNCGTYPYQVQLFLPRFSIDTRASLVPALKALGVDIAFDPAAADFSGIHVPESALDGIFISKVIHQANISVDEKGTIAAAATAITFDTGGCTAPDPLKTITVRFDRPFLFVLRDVETGAVLFMGRVVDPSVGPGR